RARGLLAVSLADRPGRVPDDLGSRHGRLRVGPVVVLVAVAPRQPADVGPVVVGALELLVRDVAVLVPVLVLLGDAEVHERAVPEVGETHGARNGNARGGGGGHL